MSTENQFGKPGSPVAVDVTRLSNSNDIILKIKTETGTLEVKMTPEQFALALTGRCECEARIYRTSARKLKPAPADWPGWPEPYQGPPEDHPISKLHGGQTAPAAVCGICAEPLNDFGLCPTHLASGLRPLVALCENCGKPVGDMGVYHTPCDIGKTPAPPSSVYCSVACFNKTHPKQP